MARKRRNEGGGGDSWMNTYADMVTLLLTFFAVLLSMSTVNQQKFNAFIRSFSNLPPEEINEMINTGTSTTPQEDTSPMDELYVKLTNYVQSCEQSDAIGLSLVDDIIFVRFDSSVFFMPDQYTLREGSDAVLSAIGNGLSEYKEDIKLITVYGHTATTQRVVEPVSDWMLSGERAAVVAQYLEDEESFPANKLVVMGYGDNFPVADNSSEAGRKKNRRVELAVVGLNSTSEFDPFADLKNLYQNNKYPISAGAEDVLTPDAGSLQGDVSITAADTPPGTVQSNSSEPPVPPDGETVSPYEDG